MKEKEHFYYMDFLRILATFAVILLHTAAQNWDAVPIHSPEWSAFNLYDGAVRWSVPVFIMISGALMLSTERSFRTLLQKNILRIATAFLFWSALYAGYHVIVEKEGVFKFFTRLIRGEYHLWFLYMIIGLYLLIPLLRRIIENTKLTRYFLLLSLIFTFIIPQIGTILGLVSERAAGLVDDVVTARMNFFFTLGYVGYFVLGYYLHHQEIGRKTEVLIYTFGVVGFILTIALTAVLSSAFGEPNQMFYGYLTVNVLFQSMAMFLCARKHFQFIRKSDKIKIIMRKMSDLCFGAYLSHVFVLIMLEQFGFTTMSFLPGLSVPVLAFCVFVVSMGISFLLHRIPWVNRYLV